MTSRTPNNFDVFPGYVPLLSGLKIHSLDAVIPAAQAKRRAEHCVLRSNTQRGCEQAGIRPTRKFARPQTEYGNCNAYRAKVLACADPGLRRDDGLWVGSAALRLLNSPCAGVHP